MQKYTAVLSEVQKTKKKIYNKMNLIRQEKEDTFETVVTEIVNVINQRIL